MKTTSICKIPPTLPLQREEFPLFGKEGRGEIFLCLCQFNFETLNKGDLARIQGTDRERRIELKRTHFYWLEYRKKGIGCQGNFGTTGQDIGALEGFFSRESRAFGLVFIMTNHES